MSIVLGTSETPLEAFLLGDIPFFKPSEKREYSRDGIGGLNQLVGFGKIVFLAQAPEQSW